MTVGGGPDDDQHARPVLLQADVEVEGIGPQVDVALAVQVALAPGGEHLLPYLLQPNDVGRRQPDDAVAQNRAAPTRTPIPKPLKGCSQPPRAVLSPVDQVGSLVARLEPCSCGTALVR